MTTTVVQVSKASREQATPLTFGVAAAGKPAVCRETLQALQMGSLVTVSLGAYVWVLMIIHLVDLS